MASMEECLDITLTALKENWNKQNNDRVFLKRTTLLEQFGLPEMYRKDEFFNRVIEKLVKDGYAEIKQDDYNAPYTKPDIYEQRTLITIEGYFFINKGGYIQQEKDKNLGKNVNWINIGVIIFASVFAGIYYLGQILPSCKSNIKKEPPIDTSLLNKKPSPLLKDTNIGKYQRVTP